jgi:Protein of unknown function (DUF3999)
MSRWLFVLCLAFSAHALAAPAKPEDFAYGVTLSPLRSESFHRYPLPPSVLRMLTSPELADLCVFDDAGTPRAHAVVWPAAPAAMPIEVPLAVFPLEISRDTEGVEVKVERDVAGQILRTLSQPLLQREASVRAYLLDAHALKGQLAGLSLELSGARDAVMLEVRVEASQDLTAFHELTRTTIAQLQHAGNSLQRDFIPLPDVGAAYLRLSFDPGPGAITLAKATAHVKQAAKPLPRSKLALDPSPGDSQDPAAQLFRYLIPHGVHPDRYSVLLPAGSELAQAALYGADVETAPLLLLDRQVYLATPAEFPLTGARLRMAELRVDDVGGGIRSGAPRLQLGYLPPELLFAGSAAKSFTLAYGSSQARCTALAGDIAQLEASARQSVRALRIVQLGGPARLTPLDPAKSPRAYALWAALVLAVVVLGVIARRLLRAA